MGIWEYRNIEIWEYGGYIFRILVYGSFKRDNLYSFFRIICVGIYGWIHSQNSGFIWFFLIKKFIGLSLNSVQYIYIFNNNRKYRQISMSKFYHPPYQNPKLKNGPRF